MLFCDVRPAKRLLPITPEIGAWLVRMRDAFAKQSVALISAEGMEGSSKA